ncbi:unnamed protein product, partial [Brassica oleracea]
MSFFFFCLGSFENSNLYALCANKLYLYALCATAATHKNFSSQALSPINFRWPQRTLSRDMETNNSATTAASNLATFKQTTISDIMSQSLVADERPRNEQGNCKCMNMMYQKI